MAVSPNTDEAFLREVDEELRRDQMASYWTRYGFWIIGAIVLGLAVFAGVLYWRYHQQQVAGRQGEQLSQVFDSLSNGKDADAQKPLVTLAQSKVDGYRAIALFTQADILLKDKDTKGAAAKFAVIAKDGSLAQPFRDLALIRQTSAEYDTLKPDVVVNRLRPLAVAGSPWLGNAGEMVAVAYIRMNKPDLAGKLFGQIARDDKTPPSLRQRAVQMAGLLGVDAIDQNEGLKAK